MRTFITVYDKKLKMWKSVELTGDALARYEARGVYSEGISEEEIERWLKVRNAK